MTDSPQASNSRDESMTQAGRITRAVIKTVAGIALTDKKDFVRLAAHGGDELLKGHFSQVLFDTYSYFMNKGEIDPAYFDSSDFADLSPELNKTLNGNYGKDKLNTVRKIFVNLAINAGDSVYKKYLLDIALEMSEPEIKVLITDHKLSEEADDSEIANDLRHTAQWLTRIASDSGLKHESLVRIASDGLIAKGLFTGYIYTDNSAVEFYKNRGRATTMGEELCTLAYLSEDPLT